MRFPTVIIPVWFHDMNKVCSLFVNCTSSGIRRLTIKQPTDYVNIRRLHRLLTQENTIHGEKYVTGGFISCTIHQILLER
jgi:hypothetical protein